MKLQGGVVRVANADMSAVIRDAHAQRISTYTLANVTDRASFFDAIRAHLPLDPPLVSHRSWDALIDSLSGGLADNKARAFLIAWPHEEAWNPSALEDRDAAYSALESVAKRVGNVALPQGGTKQLTILIGSG